MARILAKESVTNLQTSDKSHRRASQMRRTSVGYLPTSCRPCLPAHRTLYLFLPTRKTTHLSRHKVQNSFGLKIFQQLSEQSSSLVYFGPRLNTVTEPGARIFFCFGLFWEFYHVLPSPRRKRTPLAYCICERMTPPKLMTFHDPSTHLLMSCHPLQ